MLSISSPACLSLNMSSKKSVSFNEHKTTLYTSLITIFPCPPRVFKSFAYSCLAVSFNLLEYLYNASKNDFLTLIFSSGVSLAKYTSLIIISGTRISIIDVSCCVSLLLLNRCNFFISSNSIFFATIIAAASSLLPPPVTTTFLLPCLLNLMSGAGGGEFGFVIVPYSSSSNKEFFILSL